MGHTWAISPIWRASRERPQWSMRAFPSIRLLISMEPTTALSLIHISPQERARRRHAELLQKGEKASFEEVLADIVERDYNDSHRAVAPLRQAQDAILVDTTHLDLEKSVERIHQLIKERQSHVDRL